MPVTVLIVDDHAVVRQGLRVFLGLDPELSIVGEAADGAEALRLARQVRPDVIVMDLLMPGMNGVEATAAIRREMPATQVIALTSVPDDFTVVEAVRAGAIGYLLKDSDAHELRRAVHAAATGQTYLSPAAAERLMQGLRAPQPAEALTERETEVLRLVALGYSNRDISATLQVTEATVKTHVSSLLAKLGLASRTQAALYAVRIGLGRASAAGAAANPPKGQS